MGGPPGEGLTPATAEALAFVADLERPQLDEGDEHHLRRVLRLRPGAPIVVGDGAGRWRTCRLGPSLTDVGEVVEDPVKGPEITIAFSIPKAEKPEFVVQKLTELGADRIVLMQADRTIVRWEGARAARHVERLRRVAREASMQARRTRLPDVAGPVPFAEAARWPGATRADRGGAALTSDRATLLVGPEGGWTEGERRMVPAAVTLAPYVLRVETAAIAAATLLGALRSRSVSM